MFRIKCVDPDRYTVAVLEPFVGAALLTAFLVAVGVVAFALGRYRTALTIAAADVGALFVYKVVML